jgi:ribose 5-phosphate isomerase A
MQHFMDLKEEAARSAITLIKDNTIVGLGDGSTIAHLIKLLLPKISAGLRIQLLSSSFSTRQLLMQHGLPVLPVNQFERIDIYFDGCDQVDRDLNALKSGGGIHTMEKLMASMAVQFVLVGDESKLVDHFDHRFPVVLEVLPQAVGYVPGYIQKHFPLSKTVFRISEKKDGYLVTENGNYLLELWIREWPDLSSLNGMLKRVTGVVETSLFYKLANKAIIATANGVRILEQ